MAQTQISSLVLADTNLFPAGSPVVLNQEGITVDTSSLPFSSLLILPSVLPALRVAPDATTLKVQNTVLVVDPDIGSQQTVIKSDSVMVDGYSAGGPVANLTSGELRIEDNGSINSSHLTADYLQLKTTATSQALQVTSNSCQGNGQEVVTFSNAEFFLRQSCPFAMKVCNLGNSAYVERFMAFVYCYKLDVIRLRHAEEYLDGIGGPPGWSTIISNHYGNDMQIETTDPWYSHNAGENTSPIILKKFSTCRVTLVYNEETLSYYWAVSQF